MKNVLRERNTKTTYQKRKKFFNNREKNEEKRKSKKCQKSVDKRKRI